jgi:hypothetical protein
MKKDKNDRYCTKCGKKMMMSTVDAGHYNSDSGIWVNSLQHTWTCPDFKWILFWLHSKFNDIPQVDFLGF